MDSELQDMYDDLEELYKEVRKKEVNLVFDTTGLQEGETAISKMWKCDKSPIGYCVYDRIEDPPHDHCVYCDKPEDRD